MKAVKGFNMITIRSLSGTWDIEYRIGVSQKSAINTTSVRCFTSLYRGVIAERIRATPKVKSE